MSGSRLSVVAGLLVAWCSLAASVQAQYPFFRHGPMWHPPIWHPPIFHPPVFVPPAHPVPHPQPVSAPPASVPTLPPAATNVPRSVSRPGHNGVGPASNPNANPARILNQLMRDARRSKSFSGSYESIHWSYDKFGNLTGARVNDYLFASGMRPKHLVFSMNSKFLNLPVSSQFAQLEKKFKLTGVNEQQLYNQLEGMKTDIRNMQQPLYQPPITIPQPPLYQPPITIPQAPIYQPPISIPTGPGQPPISIPQPPIYQPPITIPQPPLYQPPIVIP